MYANGKWYDTATIPATESRADARIEMNYTTRANVKNVLELLSLPPEELGQGDAKKVTKENYSLNIGFL